MKPVFTLLILVTFGISCKDPQGKGSVSSRIEIDTVARGKYLVETMDCTNCHSPKVLTDKGPVPDESRQYSGHPANERLPDFDRSIINKGLVVMNGSLTAFSGPWGTSYAANLTPDESGIGNWTFQNFVKAMREGKFKGMENSRMILPPMPWQAFRHLTDNDLRAMFVYLKTLKPVANVVPSPEPPSK